jgi:hypothetical protein
MRKSRYSMEKARAFCARIAEGEPLDASCAGSQVDKAMVLDWLCDQADFRWRYARARELYADLLCDQVRQIVDTKGEDSGAGAGDLSQHDKLRIDIRKWLVARWSPKTTVAETGKDRKPGKEPVIQVITGVPRSKEWRSRSSQDGA